MHACSVASVVSNSLHPHRFVAHLASLLMGILQARILEWVAMPSSRGSSQPRDRTQVSCFLHWQAGSLPLASPYIIKEWILVRIFFFFAMPCGLQKLNSPARNWTWATAVEAQNPRPPGYAWVRNFKPVRIKEFIKAHINKNFII